MTGSANQSLGQWLERRRSHWEQMEALLTRLERRQNDGAAANELVRGYRELARDLAMARHALGESRLTAYLEGLFMRSYELIHQRPGSPWRQLLDLYRYELPRQISALRGPIAMSLAIFVAGIVAGWWLITAYPSLTPLFASEGMIAEVQRGNLWTDDLLNVVPSSLLSLGIMTNNIAVTFFAFALGAFYGLGTLYILGLNGLMLGGVFAFVAQHGLHGRLFEFVVAHGFVELSVIILAGAAGIRLGEALIRPGDRSRREAFQHAVRQAAVLIALGAPFLVGAGIIEGYISPDPAYDLTTRLVVGLTYWILFLLVLSGRIWPSERRATAAEECGGRRSGVPSDPASLP